MAYEAFSVFCFFLFVNYACVAALLSTFREKIVEKVDMSAEAVDVSSDSSDPSFDPPALPEVEAPPQQE